VGHNNRLSWRWSRPSWGPQSVKSSDPRTVDNIFENIGDIEVRTKDALASGYVPLDFQHPPQSQSLGWVKKKLIDINNY
jgi:hypothetical protein